MALDPSEAREQAPAVRVDHEHRPVEGVEQDVVGGLGADPVDREQIGADRLGVARLERRRAASLQIPPAQAPQPFGLDPEMPRWPEGFGQIGGGEGEDAFGV